MNTSAVNNPANLFQVNNPNTAKQDAASTSDADSFNQVLSREISGNSANASNALNNTASANANNTNDKNKVNANNDVTKPSQQDSDNSDTAKSEAKTQDTATADAGKKADDDKVASGKDVRKEDDKDKNADNSVTADPASIAAFVAALTSAKAAPAAATTTTATTATATVVPDAKIVLTDSDLKAKNNAIDVASGIANPDQAADGKDAIGKKSDFVSALDKATADAGEGAKASADAAKADIELAAAGTAAKAIKVLDTAIVNTPQTFAVSSAAVMQPRNDNMSGSSSSLLPQVGAAGWDQALGQKVVWMAKGAEQTATLTLNPPDLGPMQVTVNVSNNQATASFTAHQPEVRQALEASMPKLREMLSEAGIQLGQSSVSGGNANQQGTFDQGNQAGSGRRAQSSNAIDATVHVSHIATPAGGSGMVDTFA